MNGMPVTEKQVSFIHALRRRHKLAMPLLDAYCERRFGAAFAGLDRAQASALIDEMQAWDALPVDLQRAQGQLDLFEVGP